MHLLIVIYAATSELFWLAVAPMKACMYSSKRDWGKKDVARTYAILCKCKDGVSIFIITLPDFYLSIQDPIAIVARAPIFNIQAPWIPGPNAHCLETCRVCCDCPIVRLKAAGNEWPGGSPMWKLSTPNTQVADTPKDNKKHT